MSKVKATNERGHFLNDEQKNIKQKIMQDCLEGIFGNIEKNQELFKNPQQLLDLVFSILVMFNREVLSHTFISVGIEHKRDEIMKNLFQGIKDEVNRKIKSMSN